MATVETHDLLNRGTFVDFMKNQLLNGFGRNPIGLDGAWGVGKSHFLYLLKANLEVDGHVVVYIDAWQSDFASEPLVSIVSEISSHPSIKEDVKLDATRKTIRGVTNKIKILGINLLVSRLSHGRFNAEDVSKFLIASNIFKESVETFENEKLLILELKELLSSIVDEIGVTNNRKLIVLIDELDRCNPEFAVQLLERVKHIFNVPELKIIAAFDQDQLMATIKNYYGQDFDAQLYLEKFFPYIQKMPLPSRRDFIRSYLATDSFQHVVKSTESNSGLPDFFIFEQAFVEISDSAELSLRRIQNLLTRLSTAILNDDSNRLDPTLTLALIYLRDSDKAVYDKLEKGSNDFSLILKHFDKNEKLRKLGNINLFKYMEALIYFQEINADHQKNLNPNGAPINGIGWLSMPKEAQEKLSRISGYQTLQPIASQYLNVQETIRRIELTNF